MLECLQAILIFEHRALSQVDRRIRCKHGTGPAGRSAAMRCMLHSDWFETPASPASSSMFSCISTMIG